MPKHLLLISLGPVQDFIATARRCQDLWYGSWLLSELSRTVAIRVQELVGEKAVILPSTRTLTGDGAPEVANKIFAVVPEGKDSKSVACDAQKAMASRLEELADREYESLAEDAKKLVDYDRYIAQIRELMEFFWVAVEWDGGDASFASARKKAEAHLAARKNTREFAKVSWTQEENGHVLYKSSMDGARECVISHAVYEKYKHLSTKMYSLFHAKPNEYLCGIGLMKRIGVERSTDVDGAENASRRPHFHSTAHMAAMPILCNTRYADKLKGYGDLLKEKIPLYPKVIISHAVTPSDESMHFDGVVLFEERLQELMDSYGVVDGDRQHINALKNHLRGNVLGNVQPCPYYVFLLADGDNMGKAISLQDTIKKQKQLGRNLDNFSVECRKVVEGYSGSLIYAGGDDVMAMLPLHKALECANELQDTFAKKIKENGEIAEGLNFQKKNDQGVIIEDCTPSLSVGLVIAHFLEPLQNVRALAKKAEGIAKDKAGRNALAIIMSKRSGGDVEVYGKWNSGIKERIDRWQEMLHKGTLYVSIAQALEEMLVPFEAEDFQGKTDKAFFQALVTQTLSGKQITKVAVGEINKQIFPDSANNNTDWIQRIHAVSNEIQIAHLINRAVAEAAEKTANDGNEGA